MIVVKMKRLKFKRKVTMAAKMKSLIDVMTAILVVQFYHILMISTNITNIKTKNLNQFRASFRKTIVHREYIKN